MYFILLKYNTCIHLSLYFTIAQLIKCRVQVIDFLNILLGSQLYGYYCFLYSLKSVNFISIEDASEPILLLISFIDIRNYFWKVIKCIVSVALKDEVSALLFNYTVGNLVDIPHEKQPNFANTHRRNLKNF